MKKIDFLFILIFILFVGLLIVPGSRTFIADSSTQMPYLMGFVKTAILATYGEMIGSRIGSGDYFKKTGLFYRFLVWGLLGMVFVLVFKIFDSGVKTAVSVSLLPDITNTGFIRNLYIAFLVSFFLNLIFAPTFMILHRITDTYLDLSQGKFGAILKTDFKEVIKSIDWQNFFGFVVLKTIPLFWIPAHTITFLLPENYRILSAGFLSIALGLILTIAKLKKSKSSN
ncbi:MAG: hypothetical protein PHZ28_05735 [Candidatus Izemoplasmatales bacterium]|nr:hypothetical protein [Candidatus Izemoplasmatales bacterium]